jgi:hypothetical protein
MTSLELVEILPNFHVTLLVLPDGSRWYRGKCILGIGYFARCHINNALYHNLPEQAFFKSSLGALLQRAGVELPELDLPEHCPILKNCDVMLTAFGVLYLTLKRGNTGREPLSKGQEAILCHIMPLLETQPSYCTIPGVTMGLPCLHAAGAQLPPQQGDGPLPADPQGLWVDLQTLIVSVLDIHWSRDELVGLMDKHLPATIKECVCREVLVPMAAAPYLKHWVLTCLGEKAQACYKEAAGTAMEQGEKLRWAATFRRVEKEDIERAAHLISRYLY